MIHWGCCRCCCDAGSSCSTRFSMFASWLYCIFLLRNSAVTFFFFVCVSPHLLQTLHGPKQWQLLDLCGLALNYEIKNSHTAVNAISCLVFFFFHAIKAQGYACHVISEPTKGSLGEFAPAQYSSYQWFSVSAVMLTLCPCSVHSLVQWFQVLWF